MQTTLLGVAIAIILALVAALVAPLVVDWNRYRTVFEDEASRLTGLAVHVNGAIDARILPSPHITLRDVAVGDGGGEPRLRAGTVELEVGLGPLVRGEVRATELLLVAPQLSFGLDNGGAVDWPALSPSFRADSLTISRFRVENGRIVLNDAMSGSRLILQKVSFDGDVRSFLGPFKGEGSFAVGDDSYGYRISGNRVDGDGALKLKLAVDPANRPLTTELDGTVALDRGVPQFEGALSVVRPVGMTLAGGERVMSNPWQLAGKVRATPSSASLRDLSFQYGPEERAVNFSGTAELTFGLHPHLNGEVLARQVDVDRMLAAPDVTHRPPMVMVKNFLETFVAAIKPPIPIAATVAVDAVTVGGTALQSLRGNVSFDDKGWRLDDVAFRAPGLTEVSLNGRLEASPRGFAFSGPAKVEAADLKTLMAWLEGRGDQPSGSVDSFQARGEVTIAADRFVLDQLSASLGRESVEGRFAYTWATADRPASLDGALRAAALDVDALTTFAKAAAADGGFEMPHAVVLDLAIGKATFAGVDARLINGRIKLDSGILHIDRLSIGDLGGAALDVNGRIDELSSQPRGQLTLDLDASTLAGLIDIANEYAPRTAYTLRLFADRLAPAKVHGVLSVDRSMSAGKASAKLALGGSLGALQLTLNGEATGVPAHAGAAVVRLNGRLDADDGGALLQLLDLGGVVAVDQLPGQMTVAASGPLDGELRVNAAAGAGGFFAAAEGALRIDGDMAPTGSLQLKASAADLRPLQRTMTGQAGETAFPVSANAIVGLAGADATLTDLTVTAAKSRLHGRIDLKLSNPVGIGGDIAGNDIDATTVAATLLGLPSTAPNGGRSWSPSPVGAGGFGALNGEVTFKFDRAGLTPALTTRDFKGVLRLKPPEIAISEVSGKLAGGRLSGGITFRHDSQALAAQGYVELADANAALFVAPNSTAVEGVLTAKLQGESQGASLDGIVGAFHGGGTVALSRAQLAGLNPAAFDAAIRLTDQTGSIEAPKIRNAVLAAMDSGRLAVPKGQAEVTIANGQIHLSNVKLQADGGADLALTGLLDLNNTTVDAEMTLSRPAAANAFISAPPELTVSVKGPLAAPERTVDVSALVGWLTLRAAEQQTRRVESLEANRRADGLGEAMRPPPPSLRIAPQGAALEISSRSNVAPPGASGFDRLRPEPVGAVPLPPPSPIKPPAANAAPASSAAIPGADKTTASTGAAAQPAPQPRLRSLLNSLFGSQN